LPSAAVHRGSWTSVSPPNDIVRGFNQLDDNATVKLLALFWHAQLS
jgi:hypothetical protein